MQESADCLRFDPHARRPWKAGRRAGRLLVALCAAAMFVAPAAAQAFDPLLEIRVAEAAAGGDHDRALALIEAALAEAGDFRVVEDLLSRKAALEEQAGRDHAALATLRRLEASVAARLGPTAQELIEILDRLAAAAERAGGPAGSMEAVEALGRILQILIAAGIAAEGDPWLERLDALARDGSPELAARAGDLAEEFETAREETARSVFLLDPEQGFTTVRIYYATDRARSGQTEPGGFYGSERGELEMGTALVSLPPHHQPGRIERPSIWSLEFREDPGRHVVLKSVTPLAADETFAEMREHLETTDGDSAFVFVHGFNVPFAEAAKRAAQMAYDMNFEGLPILYSWPSRGSMLSYIADTAVVNLSGRRLTQFLEDVVHRSGARRIHLIAHSMGNRALTDALELYALRHRDEPPAFDQVLFTAPDLDAGLFAAMVETIRPVARRVTLYASDQDWALAVSRRLHGDAPRAGQGGRIILHAAEVDSIDMTGIGDDMLAHSYYANNPSALTDMLSLFWRDAAPENRCGMTPAEGEHGPYWRYVPEECDSNALLSALSIIRQASILTFAEARALVNRLVLPGTADPEERSRLERALARLLAN